MLICLISNKLDKLCFNVSKHVCEFQTNNCDFFWFLKYGSAKAKVK